MKTLEELKTEFAERIDFLSEHWIRGDDRPPFSFGGWRDEVVHELVSFTEKAIKESREDTSTVTRFEVIDETGRAYVRYDVAVSVSFQDDDQTLKVFVKPKQGEGEEV